MQPYIQEGNPNSSTLTLFYQLQLKQKTISITHPSTFID